MLLSQVQLPWAGSTCPMPHAPQRPPHRQSATITAPRPVCHCRRDRALGPGCLLLSHAPGPRRPPQPPPPPQPHAQGPPPPAPPHSLFGERAGCGHHAAGPLGVSHHPLPGLPDHGVDVVHAQGGVGGVPEGNVMLSLTEGPGGQRERVAGVGLAARRRSGHSHWNRRRQYAPVKQTENQPKGKGLVG